MRHLSSKLRRRRGVAEQAGFTLVEAVMALVIFVGVAASLAGLLSSAISSTKVARERTIAEQAATDQIESIRRMKYDDVGTTSGNPPGTVAPTKALSVRGLNATVATNISFINDPTPTSYATSANYKRVTVVVTRNGDSKQLARQVTYFAPPQRAPYGGLNKAIIQVEVVDYALNTPVANATVSLLTGPSAPRTDTTDAAGKVTFPDLTPNPVSGPQMYYDLDASLVGYKLFPDPVAQQIALAPGQTAQPSLQLYKPATINVVLVNPDSTPFTGPATIDVTSALTGDTETFTVSGGSLAVTSINGADIIPNVNYTVGGFSPAGPLCATALSQYVPDNYPTVLSTTFTLTMDTCPSGTLVAQVTSGGSPALGATVSVTGGPYSISQTAVTDSTGFAPFTVPAGGGYTVDATLGAQSAQATGVTVTDGGVTNVPLALSTPTASLTVHVTRNGNNRRGATVVLTGGPQSVNITHPNRTDTAGNVTFTNVPAGSGYTITAYRCRSRAPDRGQLTGVAVSPPSTTVNVAFSGGNTC